MAIDYETLSQGGHAKFAEEIFKKVKARTAALDDISADVQAAQAAATTATTKASEASQSATNAAQSATDASDSAAAAAQSAQEAREVSPEGIAEFVDDVSALKSAMDSAELSIESLGATKADVDGFYEDMTVGTAEAVLSEKFTADSVPYHFRKTPYGDRLKEKIIGGTVAWNQLNKNGNMDGTTDIGLNKGTATASDNVLTLTANQSATGVGIYFASGLPYKAGHKILMRIDIKTTLTNLAIKASISGAETGVPSKLVASNAWTTLGWINTYSGDAANLYMYVLSYSSVASGSTIQYRNAICVDLTAMFGSTIADYIYNLEQITAGAGVALFRELFPKDYYEYDAGSLQSVSGLQSHDEVGKNLVSGKIDTCYINNVGKITDDANYSMYYGKVIAGEVYTITSDDAGGLICGFFDSIPAKYADSYNNQRIVQANKTVTAPIDGYIAFRTSAGYANAQLELGSVATAYEPYKKHSYPLDSSLTLRGVPKLVDNKIKFDGDWYESEGKKTERYTECDLGTLEWDALSSPNIHVFRTPLTSAKPSSTIQSAQYNPVNAMMSNGYEVIGYSPISANDDKRFAIGFTPDGLGTMRLIVVDFSQSSTSSFKAAMSGVMLVYEKATPTEESAQPYANPQRCFEGGTEEYVTTGIVPVGHESEYYENIASKIDGLPYDLSMIAPIENGTTASKAYSVGQYFLHNDQFCKAKTAIASGATFTLNTNYEVTTVANELYTALH